MKVGIPCTDATGEQAHLAIPYGQAPFFALWDTATDRLEFQSNPLAGQDHACACAITHWMQRLNAGTLITADIGRRAAQRLTEAGVEVLQAPMGNLGELLEWYRHGRLVPAPAGQPRWLQPGADHAEPCSERRAAHHHDGRGQCCGEHQGRHGSDPQKSGGHHHHDGRGQCCRERQGGHGQGLRRSGGHGGGCRHSV